jgi:hypothetical protein
MTINKSQLSSYLFVFSILVLLNVYYIWEADQIFKILCLCSLLFIFLLESHGRLFKKFDLVFVFLTVFLFLYISLPGISGIFTLPILSMLGIIVVFIIPLERLKLLGDKFFYILSILMLPSLVVYLLIVFNIELSYDVFFPSSGEKSWEAQFYRVYYGSVFLEHLIYKFNGLNIPRLLGIFDEPGLLGTISSLYLVSKKFKLNSKTDYIFLISGVLSLSLAFYVIALLYFIFHSLLYNKYKRLLILIMLGVTIIPALPAELLDLPLVSRAYSGLEDPSSLNNRTSSSFDQIYKNFINGDEFTLFRGNGNAAHTQIGTGLSSIKSLLYNYGLVGCFMIFILYFMTLINALFNHQEIEFRGVIIFTFLFIASAYQRPDLLTPHYYFFFLYGISQSINLKNKLKIVSNRNYF